LSWKHWPVSANSQTMSLRQVDIFRENVLMILAFKSKMAVTVQQALLDLTA